MFEIKIGLLSRLVIYYHERCAVISGVPVSVPVLGPSGRSKIFSKGAKDHNIQTGTKYLFNILAHKSPILERFIHLTSLICSN